MVLPPDQESSYSLKQSINKADFWRVFIITERETKFEVTEIIDIVHDERVRIALVNWHKHNSCLTVCCNHFFDSIQALSVEMKSLKNV